MIPFEEFKKLDIRIATIKKAEDHPNADKLYVLTIDIGGGEERVIVAGIRPYYTKESLIGKKAVAIVNLEQATIRGIASNGMLLAAKGDSLISILVPEKDVACGSTIS